MIQRSLVLLKPDAVQRGIVGEILHRFERAGLKMIAVKLVLANDDVARKHYPNSNEWKEKVGNNTLKDCETYNIDVLKNMGTNDPVELGTIVKGWNEEFLKSGPVLAIIFEGIHAIDRVRSICGPTIPILAPPGTIRGDFSLDSAIAANVLKRAVYNLVHASGSEEEAEEEIKLWFGDTGTLNYRRTDNFSSIGIISGE